MHLVIATLTAKADARDELAEVLTELSAASRQDEGCISYDFYAAIEDRDVFCSVEAWESAEAAAAHMQQPHVAAALDRAGDLLADAPTIMMHEVANSQPLG